MKTKYTVIFKRGGKDIFERECECLSADEAIAETKMAFALSVNNNGKPYEIEVEEDFV